MESPSAPSYAVSTCTLEIQPARAAEYSSRSTYGRMRSGAASSPRNIFLEGPGNPGTAVERTFRIGAPVVGMATCFACSQDFADVTTFMTHLQKNTACVAWAAQPARPASTSSPPEGVESAEYAAYTDVSSTPVIYDISGATTDMSKYPAPVNCPSCHKCFAAERSLRRHMERFPACANRMLLDASGGSAAAPPTPPLNEWVDELLVAATMRVLEDGVECRWCAREYATRSALHKHLKSAVACNRSATEAFKAKVAWVPGTPV